MDHGVTAAPSTVHQAAAGVGFGIMITRSEKFTAAVQRQSLWENAVSAAELVRDHAQAEVDRLHEGGEQLDAQRESDGFTHDDVMAAYAAGR